MRPVYVPNYEDAKRLLEELDREEAQRSKGITTERIGKFAHSPVSSVSPEDKVKAAWKLMKELDFSLLPVIKNDICVGRITEGAIMTAIEELGSLERVYDAPCRSVLEEPLPLLGPDVVLASVIPLLKEEKAILVTAEGKIGGILTAYDVIA
jgi:predicted transcriptional regulator